MHLKQIIIVRHAKSDWSNNVTDDFNRPLSERGESDAPLIAAWMATNIPLPDRFISSPATRAMQTSQAIVSAYNKPEDIIKYDDHVYLAGLQTLLSVISDIPDEIQSAVIVGHNPGLENLLLHLSSDVPPYTEHGKLLTTANVAQLEFINPGKSVMEPKGCRLVKLLRPADLK